MAVNRHCTEQEAPIVLGRWLPAICVALERGNGWKACPAWLVGALSTIFEPWQALITDLRTALAKDPLAVETVREQLAKAV
jgi:hypothetical protein